MTDSSSNGIVSPAAPSSSGSVWRNAFDEFAGARVLVIGASSGIGAAVALAFAECDARVCLHYNRHANQAMAIAADLRSRGIDAAAVGGDLSKPGAARLTVDSAAAALGGLDLLVNVAGAPLGRANLDSLDEATSSTILQLNLQAVIEAARAALPFLRQGRHPAIINTSSIAARSGGGRGVGVYAAAKAGVESFTRALARELASAGIRANCVAPGYIDTPIHETFSTDDDRQGYVNATPMGRPGRPDECVGAYLFLASHRLASFVTGQTIAVNGGLAFI
jgi:3-oxoacyl-[acyl-carrier protein] reductase